MTMKCDVCKVSGPNMKKCQKCGNIFCATCAMKGKDPYPKMKAANVCPYCGKMNCIFTAK